MTDMLLDTIPDRPVQLRDHLTPFFGIEFFGKGRGTDNIGKEEPDDAALFGGGRLNARSCFERGKLLMEQTEGRFDDWAEGARWAEVIIWLCVSGIAREVAQLLDLHLVTVLRYVHAFNRRRLRWLTRPRKSGPPPRISKRIERQIVTIAQHESGY